MSVSKDDPNWWKMWHRRRDIDDYRRLHGRGRSRVSYFLSLDERRGKDDWLSGYDMVGTAAFEKEAVALMDARAALPKLTGRQRAMLILRALGYTIEELARLGQCSRDSVYSTLYQARQKMQALCA